VCGALSASQDHRGAASHGGDLVGSAYLDATGADNVRAMLNTDALGMQNLE